jgi:hypothetical protein
MAQSITLHSSSTVEGRLVVCLFVGLFVCLFVCLFIQHSIGLIRAFGAACPAPGQDKWIKAGSS